ncbi:hypothetical protein ACTMQ1_26580 [Pseudomonas syringae pv. aptata]|uniref:hypothetical protein n=1 Tax=Pseudomonas syringae TaxID=317 RepID=UPI003F8BE252
MTELTDTDALQVKLPVELLDKLVRYALEDGKLANIDTMDREQWFAQKKIAQECAEAATHLLLHCINPREGTALAEAKRVRSEAWTNTQGDAPSYVFTDEAMAFQTSTT